MEAQEIKEKLEGEFYAKTGIDISKHCSFKEEFIEKLREDVDNYLDDTLYYKNKDYSDFIFLYYFDIDTIKQLVDYYFNVTNIDKADIMKVDAALNEFNNKYFNILPDFESNIFCAICKELAYDIVRMVF